MDWGLTSTIILTVGFGIATIILTIKVVKKKKPVWAYSTRYIIGRDAEAPPELRYVFGTREVNEVYKTTIVFFNMGDDKFCGDLVPAGASDINEPIVIEFKGAEILRPPTILRRSKGAIKFDVERFFKRGAEGIQLHIPILNHNDGAIIEVWHTKCSAIDIANADIPLLKEFIRQRPEDFWRGFVVCLLFFVGASTLVGFQIATFKDWIDFVFPFLLGIVLFVASAAAFPRLLKYRTFPSWSRTTEINQKG